MRKACIVLPVLWTISAYAENEKEIVMESTDKFKGVKLVIVKDRNLIKPKQITW